MTTYSVQDTLITALRVLHEWIFALWVTYSLSSFTFNRRENWSTENRAHLPEFTAHKWWCWYLHPGDWETWPFRELALVTRETGKEGDRAQQRGRDLPIGPRVTDPEEQVPANTAVWLGWHSWDPPFLLARHGKEQRRLGNKEIEKFLLEFTTEQ